jgi:hypothetical protein
MDMKRLLSMFADFGVANNAKNDLPFPRVWVL